MNAVHGEVVVDGSRLETLWLGPAADRAPTLVFLHEGLGCTELWREFPGRLAAALGWGALLYSRAGYGGSDPCPLPRRLDYLEDEGLRVLPVVLAKTGVRRAVFVGHSDGGSIALVYAGARAARSNVELLAVITEAAHVFNETCCIAAAERVREDYRTGALRERLARYHGDNVDCAFWGWNDAWLDPGFRAMNLEAYLSAVHVPCLVMQGLDDDYGTPAQVEAIARGVRGPVETQLIPDCRHAPHRDQETFVLEAMLAFVHKYADGA